MSDIYLYVAASVFVRAKVWKIAWYYVLKNNNGSKTSVSDENYNGRIKLLFYLCL